MSVAQNDRTPLDIGKIYWGGHIRQRTRITGTGKTSIGHEWVLYHGEAKIFIADIKPYMKIPYKINQIKKCEETMKTVFDRKFTCHYCTKEYANPSARRRHEKQIHSDKISKDASEDEESLQDDPTAGTSNETLDTNSG